MRYRLSASLCVMVLLTLLLAACRSEPDPTPTPLSEEAVAERAENASVILNTTWTVQSFGGPDQPIPGVDGSYPTINFMAGRFNGSTVCNYYVGSYRVEGNNVWFDPPAVTTATCEDEALAQQESAFMTILITAREFDFDGEILTLSAEGKQLMTLEALDPAPFEDTVWIYRFYQGELPSWQPALPDTTVTIVFEGDTVSGSAGCNDYTGTYTRNEDEISIGEIAMTRMTCADPEDVMEQEERYIAALQTAVAIHQGARGIELRDAEQPIMMFGAE